MRNGITWFNATSVALGLAFLYLPIVILVVYSFNDSQLVTVWGGWSTRWYGELLRNQDFQNAALMTVKVGATSATLATILGTAAAVVMVRLGRFRGRMAFSAMIYAPLVMPEVILGLSLLLFFIALDVNRGFWTITLAHVTLTMCFVAVVVQSRLVTFDRSIEEAAQDLGCRPFKAFFLITLPIIAPAVIAGWMLAFTLSLDDFVIATFTKGTGGDTLPIYIYSSVRLGVKPTINAASTLMLAVVALGVVGAAIYTRRTEAEREKAERLAAAG